MCDGWGEIWKNTSLKSGCGSGITYAVVNERKMKEAAACLFIMWRGLSRKESMYKWMMRCHNDVMIMKKVE